MQHLSFLFEKYPGLVIATPTVPIPGWKIEHQADLTNGLSDANTSIRCMEYAYLANFTGCPAISFPMGYFDGTQVPASIMGMSEWGSEETLIEWARDGEGILDVDLDTVGVDANGAGDASDHVVVGKGLRIPSGKGGKWVDVIAAARGSST